jgi:endonuclease YncB( thermonuclease family)
MWLPSLKSPWVALVCMAAACGACAHKPETPIQEQDLSKDPCGNPMTENMLWFSAKGRVSRIIDGRTILLTLPHDNKPVRVHLDGIALDGPSPFSERAKEFLGEMLLNKTAEISVNPDEWQGKLPAQQVTGVVSAPNDVALSLLALGLVRFEKPRPYTMSRYTTCKYQRAEADAHSKKLGLWQ